MWCDGVIELSVTRIQRRAFLLVGVAYCPHKLTPFEIEFHFANRRDVEPLRTILRLGEVDQYGEIRWHRNANQSALIVSRRPQPNRDWAVAVEMTATHT